MSKSAASTSPASTSCSTPCGKTWTLSPSCQTAAAWSLAPLVRGAADRTRPSRPTRASTMSPVIRVTVTERPRSPAVAVARETVPSPAVSAEAAGDPAASRATAARPPAVLRHGPVRRIGVLQEGRDLGDEQPDQFPGATGACGLATGRHDAIPSGRAGVVRGAAVPCRAGAGGGGVRPVRAMTTLESCPPIPEYPRGRLPGVRRPPRRTPGRRRSRPFAAFLFRPVAGGSAQGRSVVDADARRAAARADR